MLGQGSSQFVSKLPLPGYFVFLYVLILIGRRTEKLYKKIIIIATKKPPNYVIKNIHPISFYHFIDLLGSRDGLCWVEHWHKIITLEPSKDRNF